MKNTLLASFPSFIGDVLANVLRYRHDDVPVLVAQLVRDYPQFRADVVEEVVAWLATLPATLTSGITLRLSVTLTL